MFSIGDNFGNSGTPTSRKPTLAPATPRPPRLRRRLWLAGVGMLLFLVTLVTASRVATPGASLLGGTHGADLIPSYMAGCFVREGRPDKLMSFPEAARFQAHLRRTYGLEQNGRTGPWLNPPYFAWVFVPLSAMPYPAAQRVWLGFNLLLFSSSVVLLCRMLLVPGRGRELEAQSDLSVGASRGLPAAAIKELSNPDAVRPSTGTGSFSKSHPHTLERSTALDASEGLPVSGNPGRFGNEAPSLGWRTWALVPLLTVTSMPFIQAMASQQNTFLSLLLLTATTWYWRRSQGLRAGLVGGLLLFKPQLAAVVAAALCCSLGRRALLGLVITGTSLLVATAVAMPGALGDYLVKLPAVLPWLQSGSHYAWERQVTFLGFWRLLIGGSRQAPMAVRLLWPACAVAAGAALLPAIARAARGCRAGRTEPPDRLIAATIAATPLLMPYYMDYDLLLLVVPVVLFAAEWCRASRPFDRSGRLLLAGWLTLFPLLFVNAAIGEATRVSLTVPLLAAMAAVHAIRAARAGRKVASRTAAVAELDGVIDPAQVFRPRSLPVAA